MSVVVGSTGAQEPSEPLSWRKTGPRIAFYSSHWSQGARIEFGASDWWRLALPAKMLSENGWDVIFARAIAEAKDGTMQVRDPTGRWHDDREVIVWQRWMGEDAARSFGRARSVGQVVVNDVDDYYWAIPYGHEARRGTDPRRRPRYNREHYQKTIRASSLVTVSTPFLGRALERWGPPVELIRNRIMLDRWRASPPGRHVGWVGATSWRGADLAELRETVVPWLRERGETFYHGGHLNDARSAREQLGYDRVTISPARDVETYPQLWRALRTALVPLENSTFNAAKSWVKGLEACARGIPFVATDHPEYRELGVGRLVRRPRDWADHLDALEDPDVRAEEGKANRARAEQLSIENHWREWDATYREALRVAA